ncbi:SGNH/GDSL hydrolase family protein [Butyrivibrio sp. WCD3002]|jgi:lysophospholipase L1-like esterase|uniref:SGNH/GDSL hydrolase family protein n=1 Tax=Butyrivibrio sp. WCD3002 TaxID=1280676 RepID=UPI000415D765|nr:SGNH/GDSL hydrolase family protein [Butyrivibrio sp. WCD3002]
MKYSLKEIDNKKLWGRCSFEDNDLVLFWTESGVEFNVKAGYMVAEIEASYNMLELWLDVFVDDERIMRFPLQQGRHKYQILRGFDPNHPTRVRIARNTQSMPDDTVSLIKICSIDTDAEFLPVPERKFKIEFIGDSITSGEGSAALTREEWIPTVFDPAIGYAVETAKLLDAEYNMISQSGWGLYASWDGNLEFALPVVYKYVCGSQKTEAAVHAGSREEWDFSSNIKDAIIINLGTNDSGAIKLDKFDDDQFIKDFTECGIKFLKEVRDYNPDSVIVWVYGMLGHEMKNNIEDIVKTYNNKFSDNVRFVLLPDCNNGYVGARMHPNPEGHKLAAAEIYRCLKEELINE